MKPVVLDVETSIKNVGEDAIGTQKASPFHPDNKIVALGMYPLFHELKDPVIMWYPDLKGITGVPNELLIGHNIKFDLLHMYHSESFRTCAKDIHIWDTQLAEYLLTGHQSKWSSLNDLAMKYGGTIKDERIKEYWDNGIDTEDIPKEELGEYLKEDLKNTAIVFYAQLEQADKLGMLNLIHNQMEALMATTEMEWNGIYFNKAEATEVEDDLRHQINLTALVCNHYISSAFDAALTFNSFKLLTFDQIYDGNPVASSDILSLVLFGGTFKYKVSKGTGEKYKTGSRKGQEKTRYYTESVDLPGIFVPQSDWKAKKAGRFLTNDEVLQKLLSYVSGPAIGDFLKNVLKWRELNKDLNTYYSKYLDLVWPTDNCIHAQLNHTATATGRLSSSNPNIQNLTSYHE